VVRNPSPKRVAFPKRVARTPYFGQFRVQPHERLFGGRRLLLGDSRGNGVSGPWYRLRDHICSSQQAAIPLRETEETLGYFPCRYSLNTVHAIDDQSISTQTQGMSIRLSQ
jgi:hypothetical protein